jgi:hypothetical protein
LAEKLQKPKEIEPEVEVEEDNFWLYVAIAVANIVLFGLIIFAVIMLVRKKKEKQQGDPLEEEPEAMGAVVLDDDYSEDAVVNVVPSDDITDMLEDDVVEMSANASQINGGSEAPSDALVEQLMEEDEPTLEDVVYEEDPSEEDLNDFDQAFDLNDTDDIAVEASKNESNSPNEQSEEVEPPENEIDNISIDDLMADERDSDVESKIASDDDQQSTVDNATEDKKISDAEALADEIFASEGIEMDEEMPDLDDLLSDLDFDDDEDTSKN